MFPRAGLSPATRPGCGDSRATAAMRSSGVEMRHRLPSWPARIAAASTSFRMRCARSSNPALTEANLKRLPFAIPACGFLEEPAQAVGDVPAVEMLHDVAAALLAHATRQRRVRGQGRDRLMQRPSILRLGDQPTSGGFDHGRGLTPDSG